MFFGDWIEILLVAVIVLVVLGATGVAAAGVTLALLEREIGRWATDGLLSGDAASQMRTRLRALWAQERRVRMANALGTLGAVIVGLGVVLFFAANWGEIPRFLRLMILLVAMSGCYAAGWSLRFRRGHPEVGHAFLFVGAFVFGVTLFLVDQTYHVEADVSRAFLVWAVASAAVGLLVRSGPLAALAVITFGTWLGYELSAREEDFGAPTSAAGLVAFFGLALYGAGTAFRLWLEPLRFSLPLRLIGYTLALAAIFALSFEFVYEVFGDEEEGRPRGVVLAVLLVFAAATVVSSLVLALRRSGTTAVAQGAALLAVAGLVLIAVLAPQTIDYETGGTAWYAVLFTLVMAVLAVGAIVAGFYADETWLASVGLLFAVIEVIGRFLDPAWSMLTRSFVFLAVGALLLALAWTLERRRAALR